MIKLSVSRIAIAAFAALVIPGFSGALAQSADTRRVEDVEKENADLRARIRRLEVEKENANLRAKLQQLKGQPAPLQVAERAPASQPAAQRELIDYAGGGDPKAAFAMAPYYSWTGFYIGGNIGYGVGSDRASGGFVTNGIVDVTGADTPVVPVGAIGGVQLGYNWQGGPNWLAGFEADFQGSAQKGISCVFFCLTAPAEPLVEVLTVQHTLDYFGTVRGRFGFINNNTLFYVTGGGAYGHVNQTLQSTINEGSATFGSASTGENKFGFVVGAGLEASLGGNWTGKVEYLYMDLGSTSTALNSMLPTAPPVPFTLSASSTLHDNIVRAGLNYRFGAPGSAYNALAADLPVKASAPERVYSWNGFYVGANVGYGFGNDHDLTTETLAVGAASLVVTSDPGSSVAPKGAIGGAQLGYNWQASPHLLAGFEADLQGSAQTDTGCSAIACLNQTNGANSGTDFNTVQHQLDYFGTLRGRLGAINGNILYYGTGGVAFGHVTQSVNVNVSQSAIFGSGSSSADMIGWTVGGGIEAALWGGWTAKAEYLYMNLGSLSTTVNVSNPAEQASLVTTSTIRDHIVRIGANYHFNNGPEIIATRY
jgi:outer membrane immunogenic protein